MVRGLHIDGRSWGSDDLGDGGAGIGIHQNSAEQSSDYPDYWRENIIYEQNYIHNTRTECMYIGPNWKAEAPEVPLRNITVQDSYFHDCGRNAVTVKSAVDGLNVVQRNFAARTGLQKRDSGLGAIRGHASSHLSFRQNIVIESSGQCFGMNADRIPATFKGGYFYAENNLGVRCGVISHPEFGHGISVRSVEGFARIEDVAIDYNTIVDTVANGIHIGSGLDTSRVLVRNNLITDPVTGQAISGMGVRENNRIGSESSLEFSDPAKDDYQLSAASPAVNSGTTPVPATDLLGVSRRKDEAPDQGAFEFDPLGDTAPDSPRNVSIQ